MFSTVDALTSGISFAPYRNILLNYAVAHPHYGYTQGMSDLLAPVLAEVQSEVDAYWCFVGLMQKTIFVSSPKDLDMDTQLVRRTFVVSRLTATAFDESHLHYRVFVLI